MVDRQTKQPVGRRLDLDDFVSASFDVPPSATNSVNKLILICTTPRTAGNTLCRYMTVNGWGIPTEYFLPDIAVSLFRRWSGAHVHSMQDIQSVKDEYGNYLLAKRSRNGVFSVKLFPHQWQQLTEIVAHRRDIVDLHFILLEREDIAEQTISILATMLSRRPSFSDLILPGLAKIAEIDRNLVQRTFNWLIEKETQWPSLVASLGGSLHRLTSEDLIDNPAETLSALADKLGLPFDQAATCHAIELEKDGTYQTNLQIKGEIRMRYSHFLIELMSNARRR